jgi:hypothetical protein
VLAALAEISVHFLRFQPAAGAENSPGLSHIGMSNQGSRLWAPWGRAATVVLI